MTKEEKLQTEVITTEQAIYCMNHQYNYEKYECDDCPYCDVCEEKGIEGRMIKRAVIALKIIRDLPSVAPTQGWIPCSERLPEETGLYLITFKAYGGGYAVTLLYYEKPKKYWTRENIYQFGNDEVVAWMPLPKPYESEEI